MKEIIKELKNHLDELNHQEDYDITEYVKEEINIRINEEMNRRIKLREDAGEKDINKIVDDLHAKLHADPEKFLGLTDEVKDEITDRSTKKMREDNPERSRNRDVLENLIKFLSRGREQLFLELDQLSEMFQFINLRANTQIAIFSYIVRLNHKLDDGSNEKMFLPDAKAILDHNYKHITTKELRKIFEESRFDAFLEDTSLKKRWARKEVQEVYEATKRDFTSRQQACNILGEILEKETVDATEEDYQIIVEKMNELFFGHIAYRFISKVKKQKELDLKPKPKIEEKRVQQNLEESKDNFGKKKKQKSDAPKKQTSLNQTLREINKYFDLDSLELKESLSLDQIIYVLSLMYSIDTEESVIEDFLRKAIREFKSLHPYAIYNQGYDKFEYLSEYNSEVKEHLDMIEYILSDASIFICDDEVYQSTKRLVEEEINEIIRIINGNYTYEEKEAKKLLKGNEE